VEAGKPDPRKKDTDGDKINDGVEVNTTKTDPAKADSDGDGCNDGAEDLNQNGVVDKGETDPNVAGDCGAATTKDTDNDGIPDHKEDSNQNGVYEPANGETDPNNPDTDGDGLDDGVEDKNKDGKLDLGETDPRNKDSDCDGLIDGPTAGGVLGEDQNKNGVVDPGETDPLQADSDGDGLLDGLELGVTQNPAPTQCPLFSPDADPASTTDPTKADSDGDGIADGSEDSNQNGRVDAGELDPKDGGDGSGPAGKVCTGKSVIPLTLRQEGQPDVKIALPRSFKEIVPIQSGGNTRGLMGYDATNQVAFVLYRTTASGSADASAVEAALRPTLNGIGALSNATTQTFTTWDGYAAVSAVYDQAGGADLKARANALANTLVGSGAGALQGNAGVNGPFKLQAEYVYRSANSVVVLLALTPQSLYVEPGLFVVGDLAGGSALAQFGDRTAIQCEPFTTNAGVVDFLFVVDNSGSMGSHQQALADAGDAMANSLNNSSLDWRIAMVTTNYASWGTGAGVFRGFTRDILEFRGWLTRYNYCSGSFCSASGGQVRCSNSNDCWVTTSGSSPERCLESAAQAVADITPPPLTSRDCDCAKTPS
jgi:hypothetical protein